MSVVEQSVRLRSAWPSLRCAIHGRGPRARLVCRGQLRPSTVTRTYDVALEYQIGSTPVALVEQPMLVGRADQPGIPHTYVADERWPLRPCLYYPPDGDWREDRALAWTIIPWLLEWLIEHEVWLTTGLWCGEGVDHRRGSGDKDSHEAAGGARSASAAPDLLDITAGNHASARPISSIVTPVLEGVHD